MEIADSLLSKPTHILPATLRSTSGIPYFRIDSTANGCAFPTSCHIDELKSWTAGNCPNLRCPVTSADVCVEVRQKLVDTAICSDAIRLAYKQPKNWILVASNDDDMVPGMVTAAEASRRLVFLRHRTRASGYYDDILLDQAVSLVKV